MGHTFIFRSGSVDPATLQDGLAALLNNHTDARCTLDIRRIRLLPVSGQTINVAGTLTVDRITAISGGDDVTPSKHDTNSADLPATVLIRSVPDSVTITNTFRQIGEIPRFSSTVSGACIARMPSSGTGTGRTQYDDLWRSPNSADVERIILREGEGIAIVEDAFSIPHAAAAGFCLRNTSSGATYTVRSRDVRKRGAADLAHIAILNGSGSGVVLEVFNIQYPEEGESIIPGIRIAKISGVEGGTDSSSEIIKCDTNQVISSAIQAIEGPFRAKLIGEDNGVVVDWHTRHGIDGISILQQQNFGVFRRLTYPVASTDAASSLLYSLVNSLVWYATGTGGIIIRPGEGLAILAGRGALDNSTFNCYQVEILFNYNPPAAIDAARSTMSIGI